jgi:potassium channel subfamily K, other eukaryote
MLHNLPLGETRTKTNFSSRSLIFDNSYGDFEPQTNSAKPTFVFWALIALPTLTVLIGAVGDAVTDFVNWGMVWTGKHLPTIIKWITGLRRSASKQEVLKTAIHKVGAEDHGVSQDVEKGMPDDTFLQYGDVTVDETNRSFLITKTAQIVLGHLDEDSPRKYTYQEWNWVLKLLGEDEATVDGHRKLGQPVGVGAEVATPIRQHKKQVWSWMGQESPLLSLEDNSEPKWVLKRLLEALAKDLNRPRGQ